KGRAAASRQDRRQAHPPEPEAVDLYRRAGGGALQARSLPVLISPLLHRHARAGLRLSRSSAALGLKTSKKDVGAPDKRGHPRSHSISLERALTCLRNETR